MEIKFSIKFETWNSKSMHEISYKNKNRFENNEGSYFCSKLNTFSVEIKIQVCRWLKSIPNSKAKILFGSKE